MVRAVAVFGLASLVVACSGEDAAPAAPAATSDAAAPSDAAPGPLGDSGTGAPDATVDSSPVDAAIDAPPVVTYSGEATWYDAHAGNACGISLSGSDYVVAAMNKSQYKKSICGQCARVTGPKGQVTVRIVDLCPGCDMGDLDLSEEAFVSISPLSAGRVKITWSFTPCP